LICEDRLSLELTVAVFAVALRNLGSSAAGTSYHLNKRTSLNKKKITFVAPRSNQLQLSRMKKKAGSVVAAFPALTKTPTRFKTETTSLHLMMGRKNKSSLNYVASILKNALQTPIRIKRLLL
jgi:hypothetical protein